MYKYVVYVFLFLSVNVHCASWSDVAQGKKPAQQNMQVLAAHQEDSVNEVPAEYPANPIAFLQNGYEALIAHKNPQAFPDSFVSIMQAEVPNYYKSIYCHMLAHAYFKENNVKGELISLCNELGYYFNENITQPIVFPPCALPAVHRLCELLESDGLNYFKTIYTQDEADNDFLQSVLQAGHMNGNISGTKLLAKRAFDGQDYAHALKLVTLLPTALAEVLHPEITIAKLMLTSETDATAIAEILSRTDVSSAAFQTVITTLEKNEKTDILKAIWLHLFKISTGAEKLKAAFRVSKIERETNPARADVYLSIAASGGNNEACKEAFAIASKEPDATKSIAYYEMAAKGKHVGALVKCGSYYKNIATEKTTDPSEVQRLQTKARGFLEEAVRFNSPAARLELAIMPSGSNEMIEGLTRLSNDVKFPLRSEAQYYLGKVYLRIANHLGEQPIIDIQLRNQHIAHAESWFKRSASLGYAPSKISYAQTLTEKAVATKQKKNEADLFESG